MYKRQACGIIFVGFPNAEVKLFRTQAGVEVVKADKGFVEIKLPKVDFPLRVLLTPYANEQRLKTFLGLEDTEEALRLHLQTHWQQLAERYLDDAGFNLLVTHLYMTVPYTPLDVHKRQVEITSPRSSTASKTPQYCGSNAYLSQNARIFCFHSSRYC